MKRDSGGKGRSLNRLHKHRLTATFQHVDRLLTEIEGILNAAASKSPFPRYVSDTTPLQQKLVGDSIAGIRAQMVGVLKAQQIAPPPARFGSLHSIRTILAFIETALEELRPEYMKGYGPVPESAVAELNGIVVELQALVGKLNAYLA